MEYITKVDRKHIVRAGSNNYEVEEYGKYFIVGKVKMDKYFHITITTGEFLLLTTIVLAVELARFVSEHINKGGEACMINLQKIVKDTE